MAYQYGPGQQGGVVRGPQPQDRSGIGFQGILPLLAAMQQQQEAKKKADQANITQLIAQKQVVPQQGGPVNISGQQFGFQAPPATGDLMKQLLGQYVMRTGDIAGASHVSGESVDYSFKPQDFNKRFQAAFQPQQQRPVMTVKGAVDKFKSQTPTTQTALLDAAINQPGKTMQMLGFSDKSMLLEYQRQIRDLRRKRGKPTPFSSNPNLQ